LFVNPSKYIQIWFDNDELEWIKILTIKKAINNKLHKNQEQSTIFLIFNLGFKKNPIHKITYVKHSIMSGIAIPFTAYYDKSII
jgi:hypothetical protein